MAAVSELAYYDVGLEPWEIPKDTETSQDSQRVIYEGHNPVNSRGEQLIQVKTNTVPWGISESSLELSPGVSASLEHSESVDKRIAMENMTKYSGGGGANQKFFVRELRATYGRMKNSSKEHELEGFGEMEFVKQLGPCLIGESKDVLSAFIDVWDHENKDNENIKAAKNAEKRRVEWREYQCNRTAWKRLRKNSGFEVQPAEPTCDEPRDLERFIKALTSRFKSSTTENLDLLSKFKLEKDDTPEHLFARFNLIAKPLEDVRPRVMTVD